MLRDTNSTASTSTSITVTHDDGMAPLLAPLAPFPDLLNMIPMASQPLGPRLHGPAPVETSISAHLLVHQLCGGPSSLMHQAHEVSHVIAPVSWSDDAPTHEEESTAVSPYMDEGSALDPAFGSGVTPAPPLSTFMGDAWSVYVEDTQDAVTPVPPPPSHADVPTLLASDLPFPGSDVNPQPRRVNPVMMAPATGDGVSPEYRPQTATQSTAPLDHVSSSTFSMSDIGSCNDTCSSSIGNATASTASSSPPPPPPPSLPQAAIAWIRQHFHHHPNSALMLDNVLGVSTLRVDALRVLWCVQRKRIKFQLPRMAHGYRFTRASYAAHHLCWWKQGGKRRSDDAQKGHAHKATFVKVCQSSLIDTVFHCTFSTSCGCTGCPLYADLEMIRDGHMLTIRVGPLLVLSRPDQAVSRRHGLWGESLRLPVEQSYEGEYGCRRVTLDTRGRSNNCNNRNTCKRSPSNRTTRKAVVTKKSKRG